MRLRHWGDCLGPVRGSRQQGQRQWALLLLLLLHLPSGRIPNRVSSASWQVQLLSWWGAWEGEALLPPNVERGPESRQPTAWRGSSGQLPHEGEGASGIGGAWGSTLSAQNQQQDPGRWQPRSLSQGCTCARGDRHQVLAGAFSQTATWRLLSNTSAGEGNGLQTRGRHASLEERLLGRDESFRKLPQQACSEAEAKGLLFSAPCVSPPSEGTKPRSELHEAARVDPS